MIRSYSDLILLKTFEERFEYLKEDSTIGDLKFGHMRFLNQAFYNSYEWKKVRRDVILRDKGCDLGVPGHEIVGTIYVHHMNSLDEEDFLNHSIYLLDPEFLICVSYDTHYAITYGDRNLLPKKVEERKKFDTCPWRKE